MFALFTFSNQFVGYINAYIKLIFYNKLTNICIPLGYASCLSYQEIETIEATSIKYQSKIIVQ